MPFSRILVPLDGSEFAENALAHARRMARAFSSRVYLLRVLHEPRDSDAEHSAQCVDWRLRKAEAQRYLRDLAGDPRLAGVSVETEILDGRPADVITQFIDEHDIGLVVLSAWGAGGASELPYGGTVHKVLAITHVPYLIARGSSVPDEPPRGYRRVLVSLDGSQLTETALNVASTLDRDGHLDLELLHLVVEPMMPRRRPLTAREEELRAALVECNRRVAAGYLEELRDRFGARHRIHARLEVSSHPMQTIAETCRDVRPDLLVLAVHNDDAACGWSSEAVREVLLARIETPVLALQDGMRVGRELARRAS